LAQGLLAMATEHGSSPAKNHGEPITGFL